MSLRRKKKNKHSSGATAGGRSECEEGASPPLYQSLSRVKTRTDSPSTASRQSTGSDHSSTPSQSRKGRQKKDNEIEMGIKNVEVVNESTTLHTVEVLKRPGQTLGFYIREGNGKTTKRGVYISRIAEGSIVQRNGLLKVGDEIQEINSVNITRTNLDDVVVLMSIPKKLVLTIKSQNQTLSKRSSVVSAHSDIKPVYIHKLCSEDSESMRIAAAEINTEDSNDSGLSSEHSLRGDRSTEAYSPYSTFLNVNPPLLPHNSVTIPEPPIYSQASKSELYVSDGEHEYNPTTHKLINPDSQKHSSSRSTMYNRQLATTADAYNSDSELLPKYHLSPHNSKQQHAHRSRNNPASIQRQSSAERDNSSGTLAPPAFSSQMQQWLRKFDYMESESPNSRSLPPPPSLPKDTVTATQELDGYRNELWRQEKLLNDAIYNMEAALNVDAMLQQSTHSAMLQPSSAVQSHLSLGSNSETPNPDAASAAYPDAASAYSYLKDLPLLIRTPMKIKIDDFKLYRSDYERISLKEILSAGSMKLKIYCGHGLKSSRNSLRDLYCVIQLDNVKQAKTMIRTGAINFDWDETFDIVVPQGTATLACMIYHWDPHIRHRLSFTGTVRLANIFNKSTHDPQNSKCALKLEPRGILYLALSYCRDHSEVEGCVPNPAFFGKPLAEVLSHQGTETRVPLLVSKCVSEVVSRGLAVVGIYRLCGAVKKKQQLRQEFERHPQLVDLSAGNVPEIHAITGLLKDYLRELPDCLLTDAAYHVVERALTKDESADDSDVDSIEVVNEFVAKLQPWQQGTVVYMLNHLKQITLCQTYNKMSAANLAVCFGPIFTPPKTAKPESHTDTGAEAGLRLHIDIIKYLLEIWPEEYTTNNNIVV